MILEILSGIGFALSLYAFIVSRKKARDSDYSALCDISDRVSCTKAFSSKYGKLLGLSNSVYGMLFYIVVFLLSVFGFVQIVFYLSVLAVVGSAVLAYILYVKLKDLCIVCGAIYLVNILLLVVSWRVVF